MQYGSVRDFGTCEINEVAIVIDFFFLLVTECYGLELVLEKYIYFR